jgi:flagellar motility protein MotE (MotC chaperone)
MAITKVMHMKASNKSQIDIHLKQAIAYILNSEKLGEANLAGGINCLPETAYEMMKATKEMIQKTGGRQGYHFVISLKPGEGTPELMYDIGMRFAEGLLCEEYEAVVAVHTDKDHLHAHLVINSVNMITGHKFQYHIGDWKYILQPITNKLCEEYDLDIMPAEYSKDTKNMSRTDWEREKSYTTLIKDDVNYCTLLAEDEKHFVYLLTRLGYEVKEGKHIAVKAPGMKRFKRIDTISEDFSRENLDRTIRYTDRSMAIPRTYTFNPIHLKRAKLSEFQKKYYTRMYRLRLIEKKRFTYKSATYYQAIRQMHQLQEEYLMIVNHNIHSFMDLINLKGELNEQLNHISNQQKELYAQRGTEKRSCKNSEDFTWFRDGEELYRKKLELMKQQKIEVNDKIKIAERCFKKELSRLEETMEKIIPVGEIPDIVDIYDVEVPENPYKEITLVPVRDELDKEFVADIEVEREKAIAGVKVKGDVNKVGSANVNIVTGNEQEIIGAVQKILKEDNSSIHDIVVERTTALQLPDSKEYYWKLSLEEKTELYPIDKIKPDDVFNYFQKHLESIGIVLEFGELYDEYKSVMKCYEEKRLKLEFDEAITRVMDVMRDVGMNRENFLLCDAGTKAIVFPFDDMEYYAGVKLYKGVLDKLRIQQNEILMYKEFDKIYEVSVKKVDLERVKGR